MLQPYIYHLCEQQQIHKLPTLCKPSRIWLQNSSFEKSWEFIIFRVFVFEFVRISGSAAKQDLARLLVKLAGKKHQIQTIVERCKTRDVRIVLKHVKQGLSTFFCETRWKIEGGSHRR